LGGTDHFDVVNGAASIDDDIAQVRENNGGVGLTAWSVDGEQRLCSIGSSGERIKNSGELFVVTGDSRHHIASDTKSMTASLLAILIEDGTIADGWDSTLGNVLPSAIGTSYENVSLRELVGMYVL
jgi:CubicO group peptidase (beta-lactamase class C family)